MVDDMQTRQLAVSIVANAAEAPKYTEAEFKLLKAVKAIIVDVGTRDGKPTVDIQLVDRDGNKYVVMATGGIIEMLAGGIKGRREVVAAENPVA